MAYEPIIINIPDILRRSGLRPGQNVADLGSGREGRFALAAGKVVGDDGKVWAVDVIKDLLPGIANKATMLGINNIKTVWSDLEIYGATKDIPDNSLDVAILATMLYQSKNHKQILKETLRMLKDGGKLVIVDWIPKETPIGPPLEIRVDPQAIKSLTQEYNLLELDDFPTGKMHYCQIYQK